MILPVSRFRTHSARRNESVRSVLVLIAAGLLSATNTSAEVKKPLPVCSFEQPADLQILRPSGVRVQRVKEHETDGVYSLKCVFPGSERDTWPGLSWTPPDDTQVSAFDALALDVYNPGPERITLSWRIDDASGRKIFGGAPLPPGACTVVEIPVRRKTGTPESRRIVQIYPYVRCPRKDVTLFIDNVRLTYFSLRFTPLVYVEDGPFAEPRPADRRRGCMLFHRHWMDFVFPVSRPHPDEANRALSLYAAAAPGETEPVTVSLYALRPLRKVRARLTALRSPHGGMIPPEAASTYVVRCLNKRVTYSSTQYIADLPVYLSRQPHIDVPAGRTRRFWIDIHVPADAAPGLYSGEVRIEAADGMSAVVPVRLRVWPFRLEEPTRILGDYYQSPRPASTDAEKHARLEQDLRDMRRRGATSVGLCFGCPVEQIVLDPDGTVHLNLPENCLYVHFMNLYRDLGFPAPVVQLTDSGQAFAASRKLRFGTPEYAAAYKAFWKAMQAEARKRGWPEIIVQPVDEPGWKDDRARARNVALLKLLKQIPGQRTEQDGPGDAYFHNIAGPWADIWNYNGALGTKEQLDAARRDGHLIMIYNCDVESWRPEMDRYIAGFFQERAGIDGCYNWAYISYYGSPYDDLDAKVGTWMHVYPKLDGEPGGPSTGWQGFREGADDLRYVITLRSVIRKARNANDAHVRRPAALAEARLQGILDTIQYHRRQRGTARWAMKRRDGKRFVIRGPYSLPNGWSFPEYDAARRQIAVDIWRLLAAMEQAPPLPAIADGPGNPLNIDIRPTTERGATATASPGRTVPFVSIPTVSGAQLNLDGRLDEAVWKQAAFIPALVRTGDGSKPDAPTRIRLFADSATLFVGFECIEPKVRHLTATVTKDGGPTWKDDCVELFVDPDGAGRAFRQIVVNCLGKQFWTASDRKGWRARSKAAAWIGPDRWTAELAVPLADLGIQPRRVFGLNLCRERRPTEAFELCAWSPTGGRFSHPEKFGSAILGGACALRRIIFGPPEVGEHVCRAEVAGRGKPVRYRLDVTVRAGRSRTNFKGDPVTVPAEGGAVALCRYRLPLDAREITLEARLILLDGDRGQSALSLKQVQTVRPLLDALSLSPALAGAAAPRSFRAEVHASPSLRKRLDVTALLIALKGDEEQVLYRRRLSLPAAGPVQGALETNGASPGLYRLVLHCRPADAAGSVEQQRPFVIVPPEF